MTCEALKMNCMDYMSQCSDKQFSLAIVDPPYGNAGNENQFKGADKARFGGRFDKYKTIERTGGTWAGKYKRKIRDVFKLQETTSYFKGRRYLKKVLQFTYYAEHLINKNFN